MSSSRLVECLCQICKGKSIPHRQWRTHQDRDLRLQSSGKSGSHHPYILRSRTTKTGPISTTFPVPLNEQINISATPDLTDVPQRVASDPITQEMYDHGSLNWDDDDIQLGRPVAPFGPHIKDADTMVAYLDHHDRLNAAMALGAVPYTTAHARPPPGWLSDARVAESLQDMIAEANRQAEQDGQDEQDFLDSSPDLPADPGDENDVDMDTNMENEAQELDVSLDEDNPDPFLRELESEASPNLSELPPHLLCIYALTT